MTKLKIGVLAVQGAFIEHIRALAALGAECTELRQRRDAEQQFDGLVLPGGESTAQGKMLRDLDMFDILRQKIKDGLPVLGTCAGMILLAERLSNDEKTHLGTMPITVRRNAYGRQLGSFRTYAECGAAGRIPMTFIRAPYIESADAGVNVLARVGGHIVAAQYGRQLALGFHPELDIDESTALHRYFLDMCRQWHELSPALRQDAADC